MRRGNLPAGTVWPQSFAAEAATLDALAAEAQSGTPTCGWARLIAAADLAPDARTLVERWLLPADRMAAVGEDTLTAASSAVEAIEIATRDAFPQLEPQLKLRTGPIRDQWDGYGPGMIAHTRRLTGLESGSQSVDMLAALPIGVDGMAFCSPVAAAVVFEAVLTNPLPRLPEVVRLAWCVATLLWRSQLAQSGEGFGAAGSAGGAGSGRGRSPRGSRPEQIRAEPFRESDVLAVALLPAILAAAEIVELSRCDELTLGSAIASYTAPLALQIPSTGTLLHWWETYLQTRPPWAIAVEALGRTLRG